MTAEHWLLKKHLPPWANQYCFLLWETYQFQLKTTAPRKTKLGDYRFRASQKRHLITINRDLNPYTFLVVYLHEVAHCICTIKHGMIIKPHGAHWQLELTDLLAPLIKKQAFPQDIETALESYLKAPKAASCSHPALTRALRKYDPPSSQRALEELAEGSEFEFQSRRYRKINTRKTRVSCLQMDTKRTYLISKLAMVQPVSPTID